MNDLTIHNVSKITVRLDKFDGKTTGRKFYCKVLTITDSDNRDFLISLFSDDKDKLTIGKEK